MASARSADNYGLNATAVLVPLLSFNTTTTSVCVLWDYLVSLEFGIFETATISSLLSSHAFGHGIAMYWLRGFIVRPLP